MNDGDGDSKVSDEGGDDDESLMVIVKKLPIGANII